MPIQGQYATPAYQPASFTGVGYSSAQGPVMEAYYKQRDTAQTAERAAADATIDANAADAEAAANRASSDRTNSLATMLATQRRTPGGGIRMGGRGRTRLSASSAGGLNRASSQALAAKRKTAAQAQLTSKYASADQAQSIAAQQSRFIGMRDGVFYA